MTWRTRAGAPVIGVAAALALPGAALAHVGANAPVATNFAARITAFGPDTGALEARVVDGDQVLWLRVRNPSTTVLVPGVLGEPLLRFDSAGVWLNLRSVTAQTDRIDRFDLKPSANPSSPPLWHRLTSGHAYAWHEHRLHVLEPAARGKSTAGTVGPWSVPLVVNGHRTALDGVLDYRPPPGWTWVALACLLALASSVGAVLVRGRAPDGVVALGLAATLLIWAVRIGRELYGRPAVGVAGAVSVAVTSVVGVALVAGLLHRDRELRIFTAFFAGFGSLYQGLTMLPVLTHAIALTALPSGVARVSVTLILGLGAGALVGSGAEELRERAPRARAVRELGGLA